MKSVVTTCIVATALLLSGCGGDGGADSGTPSSQFAGTYSGTFEVTEFFLGSFKTKVNSISIGISDKGSVQVQWRGITAKGTLTGNRFRVTHEERSLDTTSTVAVNGTITNKTITGNAKLDELRDSPRLKTSYSGDFTISSSN